MTAVRSRTRASALTERRYRALWGGPPLLSYLVLLRVGFTVPRRSLAARCALTLSGSSRRTFSPLPSAVTAVYDCRPPHQGIRRSQSAATEAGGMFSVALSVPEAYVSVENPPPALAVSEHTALWSSDFPLPRPGLPARMPFRTQGRRMGGAAITRLTRAFFMLVSHTRARQTAQDRWEVVGQLDAHFYVARPGEQGLGLQSQKACGANGKLASV